MNFDDDHAIGAKRDPGDRHTRRKSDDAGTEDGRADLDRSVAVTGGPLFDPNAQEDTAPNRRIRGPRQRQCALGLLATADEPNPDHAADEGKQI